jgi:hypothetical protein
MPTISVYVTKQNYIELAEEDNVSNYINQLITADKGRSSMVDMVSKKPIVEKDPVVAQVFKPGKKGDGLHTCKTCGYMLPYYKGKCKQGCK